MQQRTYVILLLINVKIKNIEVIYSCFWNNYNLSIREYDEALKYSYNEWLFKINEKPRGTFPFEMYITKLPKNAKDKNLTDIYIPIE